MDIRPVARIVVLITWFKFGVTKSQEDIHQLLNTLFDNYSVLVRPSHDKEKPTNVNVVFTMKQMENLDMKTETMKSLGFFSITWTDEFLVWKPEDFGFVKYITVTENMIWTPDYVIDNDVSVKKRMGDGRNLVVVKSNGTIIWEPGYVASTSCNIDITYFPFDTQVCSISILSWMTTNAYQHTTSIEGVSLRWYTENGEFQMISAWVNSTLSAMTHIENETLEGLDFFFVLKRRRTFYWLCLVSPLLVFPLLSPLSFLVPADSGEKTTLAITSLLSVFVFMSSIYETLPKLSNHVSLFVLLASIQSFISFLSVVGNVIILSIYRLPPEHRVPRWMTGLAAKRKGLTPELMNHVPNNEESELFNRSDMSTKDKSRDNVHITWPVVAGFLNKICFVVFLFAVTIVTVVFGVLIFV
ncbi:neuronal acetylcholine receptor subunit alpha-3-like [Haliotis rufescens]|uniref:neuronal acetylcholine receptor subunit alpha-3-like n=1 Tax=Haliotis rufescens TaxID=6454 RepID=UPI00201EED2E|nr:neuronal acetylcholine receptor subunit alpha-3-like [Haliotis rufescens]